MIRFKGDSNSNRRRTNTVTIRVYLKESWERKAGSLVWNSKYSTSPESPLRPMSLNPYRKGWLTGRTDFFSWAGLAKKFIDSCSILEMVVWSTPWLITLKKPRVSQALTICIDTCDLSCDISIIGMSWSTATIFWDPFTIFREREIVWEKMMRKRFSPLVYACMCGYIYIQAQEREFLVNQNWLSRAYICIRHQRVILCLVESYKFYKDYIR